MLTKDEIEALLDPFASRSGTEALRKLRAAAPDLARTALDALTRLEDAEAAQALVIEQAAAIGGQTGSLMSWERRAAIRALAPASGVEALAALRARADRTCPIGIAPELHELCSAGTCDTCTASLRARLAAAEGRVAALTEALDNLLDAITAEDRLGARSLVIQGSTAALKWLIEAQDDARAALRAHEPCALAEHDAAILRDDKAKAAP